MCLLKGWSLCLVLGEYSFLFIIIKGMILFSSPSYTTMPRNRASLFATDSRSTRAHSVLASAILSDAQYNYYHWGVMANETLLIDWITFYLPSYQINQVSLISFFNESVAHLKGMMKNRVSFAVSTLVPSERSTPPMWNALYSPLTSVEPKRHWASVGRHYGALSGKRGLARCELKRPSFGCLIS
jgi:hypothetical protein